MYKLFYLFIFLAMLMSCSNSIISSKNERAGKLHSTYDLVLISEKKIILDESTAPKPPYTQIYSDISGVRMFTLLNPFNNSIYFYNYTNGEYIKKIHYEKEGSDAILSIAGYYIKNEDSIYLYNRPLVEIVLADSHGHVKQRYSLKGNGTDWASKYPQYEFSTVCPIFEIDRHLILTGLCPFSIKESFVDKFFFTACIDLDNNQIEYYHSYPSEIYGKNANWEDPLFMQVYPTISPEGYLVHSFTASHDIYVSQWNSNISHSSYGGSNIARTIYSIDWDFLSEQTPQELIYTHYLQQDLYAAILYDPWRKVYYRFMQQGIKDATIHSQLTEKPLIVIMMNEQFEYLGETLIGTSREWNWTNSFVTKEGLNIEYIDKKDVDEVCINFKIFIPKK
ncbi:DUF4221 family protein [uncultured Bacteroides sp.]|uniref:DUF4221 family protein n=1 Tax=uncultured Bacteroides sp. TaxID=162156 RepID=UPI002AAAAD01|nr:DUF4221 family protein [uncultured Bacteroides sp.]